MLISIFKIPFWLCFWIERKQKFISEVAFLPSRNVSDQSKRFGGNISSKIGHQNQTLSDESCIATEENDDEIVVEEFDDWNDKWSS